MTTNSLKIAKQCEKIIVMEEGRIKAFDTYSKLKEEVDMEDLFDLQLGKKSLIEDKQSFDDFLEREMSYSSIRLTYTGSEISFNSNLKKEKVLNKFSDSTIY